MNNESKFEYMKRLWCLQDGVIYTRYGNKPVAFSGRKKDGRRYTIIRINNKHHGVYVYEALFMLFHDRAIAEDKEIHHIDGNLENNAIDNLIELTRTQHKRIHAYQCNDPMRGIHLYKGAWKFQWMDNEGVYHGRCFNEINDAMNFRAEIEEPRRRELRLLGLNCRKKYRGVTASQLRRISRKQNSRLFRTHI